jgi:parallel beta-helix repeat protein
VSDNTAGIEVFSDSQGTRISDNVVSNNRSSGLIAAGTGVRLTDNVATGNGAFDLFDNNPSTAEGCANTWRDNTFDTKGGAGVVCIQ